MLLRLIHLFSLLAAGCVAQAQIVTLTSNAANGQLQADSIFYSVGDQKVNSSVFSIGTRVQLNFDGLHGLAIRDGKSFPGCEMTVLNDDNEPVMHFDDLFNDASGIAAADARYLNISLVVGPPLMENQNYQWIVRLWDKVTMSDLKISSMITVPFIRDYLGIRRNFEGLTCEHSVVTSDGPVVSPVVHPGQKLTFVLSGLKGFAVSEEGRVNFGASIVVRNKANQPVVEVSDVFENSTGYDPATAASLRLHLQIGDPMKVGELYVWTVRLWDKLSNRSMDATVQLEMQP
ncbi:MAG: hypothetical protein U0V64_01400 [Cyclobacteriaceae bacterium]